MAENENLNLDYLITIEKKRDRQPKSKRVHQERNTKNNYTYRHFG